MKMARVGRNWYFLWVNIVSFALCETYSVWPMSSVEFSQCTVLKKYNRKARISSSSFPVISGHRSLGLLQQKAHWTVLWNNVASGICERGLSGLGQIWIKKKWCANTSILHLYFNSALKDIVVKAHHFIHKVLKAVFNYEEPCTFYLYLMANFQSVQSIELIKFTGSAF